jgi:hypothetical protein
VCSENKVLDSRPGDHLPGQDVPTRHSFFLLQLWRARMLAAKQDDGVAAEVGQ